MGCVGKVGMPTTVSWHHATAHIHTHMCTHGGSALPLRLVCVCVCVVCVADVPDLLLATTSMCSHSSHPQSTRCSAPRRTAPLVRRATTTSLASRGVQQIYNRPPSSQLPTDSPHPHPTRTPPLPSHLSRAHTKQPGRGLATDARLRTHGCRGFLRRPRPGSPAGRPRLERGRSAPAARRHPPRQRV